MNKSKGFSYLPPVMMAVLKALKALTFSSVCVIAITHNIAAQNSINSIEVLVNDEPVSTFDIDQRLRLVIAISGGVNSEVEFLKVREQVVQSIIDERLQLQEAQEVDLVISPELLDDFFNRRAQGLGQTGDQLGNALLQIGSSKETMKKQIEAESAWGQLVQGRLGQFVSVSDEEVDAFIKRLYDNKGKFEYRLGEIVLLVASPEQEASVKANADALVERLQSGSSFPEIAQQLSASSSAAVGGDLGWLSESDINNDQLTLIQNSPVGEILDPIRTPGGYTIFALRDRRRILTADPLDIQYSLRQIHLSSDLVANEDKAKTFEDYVSNISEADSTCGQVAKHALESGADGEQELGIMRIRDMSVPLRRDIENLRTGERTQLLKMADGWRALFVCDRKEPEIQEPNFDAIYAQLEQKRMSMMARRYLRDIRRDAIIDYR